MAIHANGSRRYSPVALLYMAISPRTAFSSRKCRLWKTRQRGLISFVFFVVIGLIAIALDRPPRPLPGQASSSVFSAERATKHLLLVSRAPHPVDSKEHDAVRDYIVQAIRELGFSPQIQRTTNWNEANGIEGALENIVFRIKGSTQEKAVLFVAHYDSLPGDPGASDDGAAVAAFLESARALKTLPQTRRDLIFLFTDGEEMGLLGAQAFVTEHPWAQDVGFVFNFEARGTNGPSIMFETSDNDGWLIENFGQAASFPVANSLSYEIYKRMPNSTDFTIFRRAGYSGLNFAFINGLSYYHTRFDSIENANRGSLQHHGDYILELSKHFGNATSEDPKSPNLVYFDVLGRTLVRYGNGLANVALVFTCILVAISWYCGLRWKHLRLGASVLGLACMVSGVAIVAGGAVVASWVTSNPDSAGMRYHSHWYILAFSAIGLAFALAFYSMVAKRVGTQNLAAGALLGWSVLTTAVNIYFPGGTYLFLWPLLFVVIGQLAVWQARPMSVSRANVVLVLAGLPAIVLIAPMIHKLFSAFAAQSTLMVSVLLGLLVSLLIGQIVSGTSSRRWLLPSLVGTTALGLLITAIILH
jgi:hypothetical protein